MIEVRTNVINGQSRGCWLAIQFRYTMFYFVRFWNRKSDNQGVRVKLFAPKHDPEYGYRCTKFGINW